MKIINWKILFSVGVFLTLLSSCFGGSVAMAFSGMHNSSNSNHKMPCCIEQYSVNFRVHLLDEFILTGNVLQNIIFSLFFVVLKIFVFICVKSNIFSLYLKRIRSRYGGFKLFNYFSRLFSLGILHSKIW